MIALGTAHWARVAADGSIDDEASEGSITVTPAARYGATSRVATIKARELAVAAMQPSAMSRALPSRRARAIRLAQACEASRSKGSTRPVKAGRTSRSRRS